MGEKDSLRFEEPPPGLRTGVELIDDQLYRANLGAKFRVRDITKSLHKT